MLHTYLANAGWFIFGLAGLLLSFWMALPDNPKPRAVLDYIWNYPRIAVFNLFAYAFFTAAWLQDGFLQILPKGHLTWLAVPLAWTAGTFFHLVIKNFSTMFGGLLGKIFGVSQENKDAGQG